MEAKIEALHLEHTGVAMLPRQVAFWAASVNTGIKSIDDFSTSVSKLAIYRSHKSTLFRQMFAAREKTPITDPVLAAFSEFLDRHGTALVSASDIDAFVTTVAGPGTQSQPQTHTPTQTQSQTQTQTQSQNTQSQTQTQSQPIKPPSERLRPIAAPLAAPQGREKVSIDEELIERFERTFGRPMYVHEYFKHANVGNMQAVFEKQQENYARIHEVLRAYLDEDLGEYEYVKRYMALADDGPAFFSSLLSEVLLSEKYERLMKQRLVEVHVSMYDLDIASTEMPFLFWRVKAAKLGLDVDDLSRHVVRFKGERDMIIAHAAQVFASVLSREPDQNEVEEYVLFYRERCGAAGGAPPRKICHGADCEEDDDDAEEDDARLERELDLVDATVLRRLVGSLEFHEVLKGALRKRHERVRGAPILPSVLYAALAALLAEVGSLTPETLTARVDAALGEL